MLKKEFIKSLQEKDHILEIEVSVPLIEDKGSEIKITHKNIQHFLISSGYKIEKCLSSSIVSNLRESSLSGKWCFLLTNDQNDPIIDETKKVSLKKNKKLINEPATETGSEK